MTHLCEVAKTAAAAFSKARVCLRRGICMIIFSLMLTAVFLAYANGANDNFKGVATLFGSGTASYRIALGWACLTTFAGSLSAVWLSAKLVAVFSGKGLVPDALAATPSFLVSVGLGAAVTVVIATWLGLSDLDNPFADGSARRCRLGLWARFLRCPGCDLRCAPPGDNCLSRTQGNSALRRHRPIKSLVGRSGGA